MAVRLAAPITDMVRAAHHWEAKNHTVCWCRWRKRWKRMLTSVEDVDFDFSFAAAFGWLNCVTSADLDVRLDAAWRRTESLIRQADNWAKIGRLAGARLKSDVMTGTEAVRQIKSS